MQSTSLILFLTYAITVAFLWGVAPITHKILLSNISPITFTCISMGIMATCAAIMFIACKKQVIKDIKKCEPNVILYFALATIITSFIPFMIYLYLMKDHPSHIVTAVTYSSPFFTLFLAWFFLKEPITFLGTVGVFLVIAGIICLSLNYNKKL